MSTVQLVTMLLVSPLVDLVYSNWADWWTYDGISGPAYWGLINPAWTMCNKVGNNKQAGAELCQAQGKLKLFWP